MNFANKRIGFQAATAQAGAALVVALVFLVALTLLGLAATSGNTLQQKMAYSAGETNLAFQSAETGLAVGEAWIEGRTDLPNRDCATNCSGSASIWEGGDSFPNTGPSGQSVKAGTMNIFAASWWSAEAREFGYDYPDGAARVAVAGQVVPNVALVPRYTIEYLGKDPNAPPEVGGVRLPVIQFFQITGRGSGVQSAGTPLIVQSVYSKRF